MNDESRLEQEYLVCEALGIDRSELLSHPELMNKNNAKLQEFMSRKNSNEPLAYIVGYQPFMGMKIIVDKNVLIPRPETELLVEQTAHYALLITHPTILDIGTGSGAIAVALARLLPTAMITAIDISESALTIAKKNASNQKVKIDFLQGDLFSSVKNRKFDIVVSNPPYIPTEEVENLDPNVKDFEPRLALDGGDDGLDIIRAIIVDAKDYLNPEGILIFEIGINQSEEVVKLLDKSNYSNIEIRKDYASIPRIVVAHL